MAFFFLEEWGFCCGGGGGGGVGERESEREREALFWWVGGRKGVFDWGVEGRGWASGVRISSGDVRGKLRRTGEIVGKNCTF